MSRTMSSLAFEDAVEQKIFEEPTFNLINARHLSVTNEILPEGHSHKVIKVKGSITVSF